MLLRVPGYCNSKFNTASPDPDFLDVKNHEAVDRGP